MQEGFQYDLTWKVSFYTS